MSMNTGLIYLYREEGGRRGGEEERAERAK